MNKFLEDKKFTHCLRAQVFPDKNAKDRINSIKEFCLKNGFNNVIMMFNGECFNTGHLTDEELTTWIEVIKEAKKEFAKVGISTSINPWFEFGHLDRGRVLKPGQNFENMMDIYGKSTEMVACPADPVWREFYIKQMSKYVKEIEPDTLWIEDDFRLHNHDPLFWGGCFCNHHMKMFCEKLGYQITREEFVKKILEGPGKERDAYLEVNWETIDSLAKEISKAVKGLGLKTSVGLMSSMPECHNVENRDWKKLLNDLNSDGNKINRIHLPCYTEISPKDFLYNFNRISLVVRAFCEDDTFIYPELENGSFSTFVKSANFLRFQVEASIPLGLSGMTYDIFDFCGNGAQSELGYGEALAEITPYLSTVKSLNVKPTELTGLVFPIDQKTCKNRKTNENWLSILPGDDYEAISYFSSFGYSVSLSEAKHFIDKTVVLAMQNINNFTDEEIIDLFKNNFVILDGYAAGGLVDRNLGYLMYIKSYKHAKNDDGSTSFETSLEVLNNMNGYRITSEKSSTDPWTFEFGSNEVEVKSVLNKYDNSVFGNGFSVGKNFAILPFEIHSKPFEQFSLLRVYQFDNLETKLKGEFVKSQSQCIYSYLYKKEDSRVLILTNSNTDTFKSVSFSYYGFNINKVFEVCRDGEIKEAKFIRENNIIKINEEFGYMSTKTFILK